jgi:hypothetical protein
MALGEGRERRGKGEDVNVSMPKVNSDPVVNCQNVTSGQHQVEFRGQNTGFGHNTRGPKREGKIRMEEGRGERCGWRWEEGEVGLRPAWQSAPRLEKYRKKKRPKLL